MDKYEFNIVGATLYDFIWTDFCDNYIEMSKFNQNNTTKSVLITVLMNILKMLHPFMPYVTEEIFNMLPNKDDESIMISSYPKYSKEFNFDVNLDYTLDLITKVRKIKLENNIKEYNIYYKELDNIDIISSMLKLTKENFVTEKNELDEIVIDKNVSILYDGSDNKEKELESLMKEKVRLENSIVRREKLLSNENYVAKAPQNLVEQERKTLEQEKENLKAILSKLGK
jgi:valyl-tRNA synthetase